ncbi:MAG: hypothetical protein M1825_000285 [Sarcosagium campestre]|nr:MAG: hypothetical protein M1825_000285 [Sarcosagium campestre]
MAAVVPQQPASSAARPAGAANGANGAKKSKAKKAPDASETSKLLAAKISQLESDKAGEKDQEAEIEREVKKANRDLSSLLSTIESPMSRLETVQKKYTELLADMRRLDRDYAKSKKRGDLLQKEKDAGRSELSKTLNIKEKLEKLCRELQRDNKKMKDDHKAVAEKERLEREHLNGQFDGILKKVENAVLIKEDPKLDLATEEVTRRVLKSLIDQYEHREIHFESVLRAKELELQYNLAKHEQQRQAAEQEGSRSRALSAQVSTFSQTETELRSQLNIYVEKFKQVEDTLNNSNDLFLTFRKEMEEMSKKTKRLEKENLNLTRKHDLTNRNILEMAADRTRLTAEVETLTAKNARLVQLCRGMQAQGRAGPVPILGEDQSREGDGSSQLADEVTESEYEDDDEGEDDEGSLVLALDGEDGDEDDDDGVGDADDDGVDEDDQDEEFDPVALDKEIQRRIDEAPRISTTVRSRDSKIPTTNRKVNGAVNGAKH